MDHKANAELAEELAADLGSILERLDALDLYLTAAKVSSALDALAEEARLPSFGDPLQVAATRSKRLTSLS